MKNQTKLRVESYKQQSGYVNLKEIEVLKRKNYKVLDIIPDGEAPKQIIKAYFYKEGKIHKSKPENWDLFFAKFGSKSYPHESVVEFAINKIGEYLGLKMNESKIIQVNGQLRFLSKNFLKQGQKLIHGIEILAEYFEDRQFVEDINVNKKERRKYFTFEEVENAVNFIFPNDSKMILNEFVQLLTYDAIVGNNDRHFYNWGIIGQVKKEKSKQMHLTPIYDTARALFWNDTDEKVKKIFNLYQKKQDSLDSYIRDSYPRVSLENNYNASHFDLIVSLSKNYEYKTIISNLVSMSVTTNLLHRFDSELRKFFIYERSELMCIVLQKRIEKIKEIIL